MISFDEFKKGQDCWLDIKYERFCSIVYADKKSFLLPFYDEQAKLRAKLGDAESLTQLTIHFLSGYLEIKLNVYVKYLDTIMGFDSLIFGHLSRKKFKVNQSKFRKKCVI